MKRRRKWYPFPIQPVCVHRGEPVRIASHTVYAGGGNYLTPADIKDYDIIVPLIPVGDWIWKGGFKGRVLAYPMSDGGGMEGPWRDFLKEIYQLSQKKKVLVFCAGGHGRTGTFLALMIALFEAGIDDPIAEIRKRYCKRAVESLQQAQMIFNTAGRELPVKYRESFSSYLVDFEIF